MTMRLNDVYKLYFTCKFSAFFTFLQVFDTKKDVFLTFICEIFTFTPLKEYFFNPIKAVDLFFINVIISP